MSTTIGLGYTSDNGDQLFADLMSLSRNYGYGLLEGLKFAEPEVRQGINAMRSSEGWSHLSLLQFPIDRGVGLAYGIHQELTEFESGGPTPKFFDFLRELPSVVESQCTKLGIFFAGDWYGSDKVRYSYGDISRLITILSMPGNWGLRYFNPNTGRIQDSDEIPFIFDMNQNQTGMGIIGDSELSP